MSDKIGKPLFEGPSCQYEDCLLLLLPVPWEATASYGRGSSLGPEAIRKASHQLDFYHPDWSYGKGPGNQQGKLTGLFWDESADDIFSHHEKICRMADNYVSSGTATQSLAADLVSINSACDQMTQWVYQKSQTHLANKKILGLIGGDHSSPLGAITALTEVHGSQFGILHIDAHADLRDAYQDFNQSHASIMYNVLQLKEAPEILVQVGLRDLSLTEVALQNKSSHIKCFYNADLQKQKFNGVHWDKLCQDIVDSLPAKVYISFDIDGLEPAFCPNTGTPVPGGLTYDQAIYLIQKVVRTGRQIIGFDLCEVSPAKSNNWDANVGARILYNLCGYTYLSNGLI